MTQAESDYTLAEVVRTLQVLTKAVEGFGQQLSALDAKFVPRELYAEKQAHLTGRVDEIAREVTDLTADQARFRKEQADRSATAWRFWVGLVLAGLILPVIVTVLAANMIGGLT
jgi:hypothetical protein